MSVISSAATDREFNSVGVIGAGIMGAGIAVANVKRQVAVVMSDADPRALRQGVQQVAEEAAFDETTQATDAGLAARYAPFLRAARSDEELAECDVVIESIIEDAGVKQALYRRLEAQLGETAILGANTSTIPITRLAEGLERPERFCGLHF